ncbi:MAG: hypothetical protein OSJ43_05375 [Oscillospiraceae bacterium]|nr:hypothetical protein [Oscillospiraceae bacterium]
MKYHVTPGENGYTPTAGKQIRAICGKARAAADAEKKNAEAELRCKIYLNEHPEVAPLTGYEIANLHLYER